MFWGLIMEPGKKYSQTVDKSFHISQAALDLTTAQNDPVQVLLGYDDRHYLICTLQKGRVMQVQLDLNFQAGDEISFATNGAGHVHLTGYRVPEDDFMDEEEEEAEDEEEIPNLTSSLKRKASEVMKKGLTNVQKKTKMDTLQALNDADDTDDSNDSDVSLSDLLKQEGDLDDTLEEEAEDDDGEEEDDEDDDDDDDDESDDDQSEEESEPVKLQKQKKDTPKQNGIVKMEKSPKGGKTPQQANTPKQPPNTPKQQTPAVKNEKQKTPKENKQNQQQQQQQQKGQKTPGKDGGSPQKKTVEGGVVIEDLKVGEGPVAKPGKFVQVYYEGRLKSNNKMFDSSNKGPGFKFRLGKQEVIKAWDIGVSGMKVGGKRRIVCPPHMAYGAQGSPPVIPPNSTLVFEVELKNVK